MDALDQDGTEPSEENLRHRQGVFIHHKRGGLHHLEIRATTDQYEVLTTVMNTATNPRTTTPDTTNSDATNTDSAAIDLDTAFNAPAPEPDLDRRTPAQQRLDGLVGATKAALAAGTLPTTGGLRPQVMVTIGYQDLLNSIKTTAAHGPRYNKNHRTNGQTRPDTATTDSGRSTEQPAGPDTQPASEAELPPGTRQAFEPEPLTGSRPVTSLPGINWAGTLLFRAQPGTGPANTPTGSGTFTYTGPVTASTIRKIACDADIIPVLLGSQGRILDIGRATRVFPPHIRKALNARDQGCAFPNCTIPASWCEAHHITYWSQGGTTSTDNGVLLCTHHHHLIHKELWKIHVKNGIPWFIPPPHIDPRQQPRQNHHHKT
nr:HNH endonuclease signature motif containing protein [Arthrobacter sp. FW305-BF8]